MPEIVEKCPFCASRNISLFERMFRDLLLEYHLCKNCGLVFQSPRMTREESVSFCTGAYYQLQEQKKYMMMHNSAVQRMRAKALVDFTHDLIHPNSHLDIGCSSGTLLQYFQVEYEHLVSVGIEPDKNRRIFAWRKGLDVYSSLGELETSKYNAKRFELITMSHVLEHLREPFEYLRHLRYNVLALNGHLLLEVPNLYAHDCFELSHLFAFNSHTLQELLRHSGFDIIKFEKHGRPHSEILPVYLTVLCRPTKVIASYPICPEKVVKFKRKVGLLWLHILVALFSRGKWFVKDKGDK